MLDIEKDMHKLKTVRKLDLSFNELTELPRDPKFFSNMEDLEFLALGGNQIPTIDKLRGLKGAKKLRYLDLVDNPIQIKLRSYRYDMAQMLPWLYGLDQNTISYDEKEHLLDNKSVRYCSMNTFSQLNSQAVMTFVPDFSAAKHLKLLDEQIALIKKTNEKNDPVKAI